MQNNVKETALAVPLVGYAEDDSADEDTGAEIHAWKNTHSEFDLENRKSSEPRSSDLANMNVTRSGTNTMANYNREKKSKMTTRTIISDFKTQIARNRAMVPCLLRGER